MFRPRHRGVHVIFGFTKDRRAASILILAASRLPARVIGPGGPRDGEAGHGR